MANGRFQPLQLLAALLLCGCTPWLRPPASDNGLPKPLMSTETVVLEVAFVHLTPDEHGIEEATWRQLDEQVLPVALRQQLAGNGLRSGIASSQIPQALRDLAERTSRELSQAPSGDDVTSAETASLSRNRRMQVRAGKRGKIVVSAALPSISVLAKDEQGRVQGAAFQDAQCLFSLLARPGGDGRTALQLTPEIEHGDLKNRWVPVDGALVNQVGKSQQVYDELRIDVSLPPGQTLVIGPTTEVGGLGQHFFTQRNPTPRRTLLLVRVAQTQQDDLFQKQQQLDTLVSSSDGE
jgi:hypothetical protein